MLVVREGRMFSVRINDEGEECGKAWDYGPIPTPEQVARFQRHVKAGTTPGNPPWYKPPTIKPFKVKPGAKPVFAKDLDELRIEDAEDENPLD